MPLDQNERKVLFYHGFDLFDHCTFAEVVHSRYHYLLVLFLMHDSGMF